MANTLNESEEAVDDSFPNEVDESDSLNTDNRLCKPHETQSPLSVEGEKERCVCVCVYVHRYSSMFFRVSALSMLVFNDSATSQ